MRPVVQSVAIGLLVGCLTVGCATPGVKALSPRQRQQAKAFFSVHLSSPQAKQALFHAYRIQDQYAIVIYANQMIEPPMMGWAWRFAEGGAPVTQFVKVELQHAKDDLTIRDLIRICYAMSRLETYDVAGDTDLMKVIDESVKRIRDDGWKRIVEQDVNVIRQKSAGTTQKNQGVGKGD
jgi:hypothetical protein